MFCVINKNPAVKLNDDAARRHRSSINLGIVFVDGHERTIAEARLIPGGVNALEQHPLPYIRAQTPKGNLVTPKTKSFMSTGDEAFWLTDRNLLEGIVNNTVKFGYIKNGKFVENHNAVPVKSKLGQLLWPAKAE